MAAAVGPTALAAPLVDSAAVDAAVSKPAGSESSRAHRRGLLLMTAGLVAYIPDGTLVKLVRAPADTAALWRMSLAGCALLAWQLAQLGRALPAAVHGMGRWGASVTVLAGLSQWLFVEAVKATTVANTLLPMATTSFWAALLGRALLGTPVRPCTWAAMPVVFAGVAVSVSGGLRASLGPGDLLALGIAVASAVRRTILRHKADVNMQPAVALGPLLLSLALLARDAAEGVAAWEVGREDLVPLLLLGLVVVPMGMTLTTAGSQLLPSAESGMLICVETVCSPVLAAHVVGEKVPAREWLGLAIVVTTLVAHAAAS